MISEQWPADKVERVAVAKLIPYARNARTHSDAQVAQIAASMKEWGWTNPVLIAEDGGIIAGHGRVLAAKKLGFKEVPCMTARGWSQAQKRAYVIADNKLALNAGWDNELLKVELQELQGLEFDLPLIGFDDTELAKLLQNSDDQERAEETPETPEHPVTIEGDVWLLGKHRIVCGDSTKADVADKALNGVKPHLMVTDPPSAAMSRGDYHWRHEPCWYAVRKGKTGHWAGDRKQNTAWDFPGVNPAGGGGKGHDTKVGHGTQKPIECMKRPIENNSSAGQAVYEPFSGSGTTIMACELTQRVCHAIELNPAYVDVAVIRWQDFTGQKATLESDGRTFEAVKKAREAAEVAT